MELPTIQQLECFIAVADTLNFRQAAERCFITQPALSAQIKQLENTWGLKLFERNRRRVLPTAAGVAMTEKARRILADLHRLGESALSFGEPLTGTLRLGVIPTVAPYLLPKALAEVHRRFPQLRLLLREGQTSQLLAELAEGRLDLALLALGVELGDAESLPLFQDPFLLAVAPEHPLAKRRKVKESDLHDETVLLLDDGHCLRDQALKICSHVGACELGDFRASSLGTLVQMVSAGVGVTLLPQMSASVEGGPERHLKLIPFRAGGPSREIGLIWRPESTRQAEFKLLGDAIVGGMA